MRAITAIRRRAGLKALPRRLAVIGRGPLGCELAQAFCRLGSHVTIVEMNPKFLPIEERDAAELLSRAMARDGVIIRLNTTITAARLEDGVKILDTADAGVKDRVEADEILVSVGRVPNVEMLGLERAGIAFDTKSGITVDARLRSTNPERRLVRFSPKGESGPAPPATARQAVLRGFALT